MKKLFLYYTYTGNGDVVAGSLSLKGYEIRKVETLKRPIPKSFFFGMLIGGFRAAIKRRSKIKDFDASLEGYDEIIIGSPIWNGNFACPANSILDRLDLKEKNVTFLLYSGSGEGKGAEKQIHAKYPSANIVFLKEPKKYAEELEKLN